MKGYAAVSPSDDTLRQGDPGAAGGEVERVEAGPVLEDVIGRVGFSPGDLEGVDKLFTRKVEDDPLWMERVIDLTWRVFPASAPVQDSFTLYDGTVARVRQTPLRADMQVEHSPQVRSYEVILPAAQAPRRVMLDGNSLGEITNQGKNGWRMDADSQTLHVMFRATNFDLNVDK